MPNRRRFAHMSYFRKYLVSLAVLVVATSFVVLAIISRAAELEDGTEVEKNSLLTYYLHVKYDGVDVSGTESTDEGSEPTTAEVLSDRIKVTDTLPKGLTFEGFVTSEDGSFGAVERFERDGVVHKCSGNVIDDTNEDKTNEGTWDGTHFYYHGLHYDSTTRQVSFYVSRLKAGCELTIGIITRTPATVDDPETTDYVEIRRDFYNTAFAKEDKITARSNTVHVFMGSLVVESNHNVTYTYTGDTPTNAPTPPETISYNKDTVVYVEPEPHMDGYSFSGWQSNDVEPINGYFDMPDNDVTFTGTWVVAPAPTEYSVVYRVSGKGDTSEEQAANLPSWAVAPKTHTYAEGVEVSTDSTEAGNYDGYKFSGWFIMPVDATETTVCSDTMEKAGVGFVMPAHNVNICGYYERIKYTVTYQFEGTIIPPNADDLLPDPASYYPGDTVTTAENPTASGYRFLGWYKSESFTMPEENVVIFGEWGIQNGTFSPTITKEVLGTATSYNYEDTVQFKITLCNTADYPIYNVVLQEQLQDAAFMNGANSNIENVELETELPADSILKIVSIPANSCAITYSSYVVHEYIASTITNTVEMIGALADNDNNLDTSVEYKASANFNVEDFSEPDPVTGVNVKNSFVFIGLVIITVIGGSVVILNRRKS